MKGLAQHFAGLRIKTLASLVLLIGGALLITLLLAYRPLMDLRDSMATSFVRNLAQLNQEQIVSMLATDLALTRRFADLTATKQWAAQETNKAARELYLREAERYRQAFGGKNYFIVLAGSGNYYFSENADNTLAQPRYTLYPEVAKDAWFYATLKTTQPYSINVATDRKLQTTKVWFNIPIRDANGTALGVTGSGLDLQDFRLCAI